MKRKKQLYEAMKHLENEFKELTLIAKDDDYIPSEDEIHGWAIKMDVYMNKVEEIKNEVLDFYRN